MRCSRQRVLRFWSSGQHSLKAVMCYEQQFGWLGQSWCARGGGNRFSKKKKFHNNLPKITKIVVYFSNSIFVKLNWLYTKPIETRGNSKVGARPLAPSELRENIAHMLWRRAATSSESDVSEEHKYWLYSWHLWNMVVNVGLDVSFNNI